MSYGFNQELEFLLMDEGVPPTVLVEGGGGGEDVAPATPHLPLAHFGIGVEDDVLAYGAVPGFAAGRAMARLIPVHGDPLPRPATPAGNPAKHWCFTLNNPTPVDAETLLEELKRKDANGKFVLAHEVGANGTPHLQGAASFSSKKRWDQGMSPQYRFGGRIHVETGRGTWEQSLAYCCKEAGPKLFHNCKGTRPPTVINVISDEEMTEDRWIWMTRVIALVDGPVDPRKIIWVWDELGGCGKSRLAKWLLVKRPNLGPIITGGKAADMYQGVMNYIEKAKSDSDIPEFPGLVIADIPKASHGHFSFGGVEAIKNGCFAATKYEGGQCVFNTPHFVVFANFPPPREEFAQNRFIEINIV